MVSVSTQIKCIYFVAFADLFAISLVLPLFSQHLRAQGHSHLLHGILGTLYGALQLLSGPLVGSWSDTQGRRHVFLRCLVVCVLSYFLLAASCNVYIVFISRIFAGIFKHVQSLCKTVLSDITPTVERFGVQGTYNALANLGFMVGPVVGGHLSEFENGFQYVCVLATALFSVNVCIIWYAVPEYKVCNIRKTPSSFENDDFADEIQDVHQQRKFGKLLSQLNEIDWTMFWDIFLLKFILGFSLTVFFTNYSLMVKDSYQLSPKWVGYMISFQGLVGVIAGFFNGYLMRLYNHNGNILTFHGFILLMIAFVGLTVAPTLAIFTLFLVPLSISSSVLRVSCMELTLARTTPDKHGSVLGSSQSMSSFARMIAPLFSGMAQEIHLRGSCFLSCAIASIGTVCAVFLNSKSGGKRS